TREEPLEGYHAGWSLLSRDLVLEVPSKLEHLAGTAHGQLHPPKVGLEHIAVVEHEVGVAAIHAERPEGLAVPPAAGLVVTDRVEAVAFPVAPVRVADRALLLAIPHRGEQPAANVLDRLGQPVVALVIDEPHVPGLEVGVLVPLVIDLDVEPQPVAR